MPAYDEVSRLPKAFPLESDSWHPAPVFVCTHEFWRMGATLCPKNVAGVGSSVVQAPETAAPAQTRSANGRRLSARMTPDGNESLTASAAQSAPGRARTDRGPSATATSTPG